MNNENSVKDVLIIGAGPAGLTAAIYAVRYGLSVAVFEKKNYGGQVSETPVVDNYPAIESISGYEFSKNIYEQAKKLGAEIIMEDVENLEISGDIKLIKTKNSEFSGKALIIANGAKKRHLNCEGEEQFAGKGVSYCATCDGNFFRNKDVAIVGGGNTALEDALFLSNICKTVYLIHRRDEFRGMKSLSESVKKRENIKILYNSKVESINGETRVSTVTVDHNGENRVINVNAVFIAIGTEPDNKILDGILDLDKSGYIISSENCRTDIQGVFAAGDTRTKDLRQIVTATADGAVSAFMAANYINTL